MKAASEGPMRGVLGYTDEKAPCTTVIDRAQIVYSSFSMIFSHYYVPFEYFELDWHDFQVVSTDFRGCPLTSVFDSEAGTF
jgi:hypothetical protein